VDEIIIIGGGFSACIARIFIKSHVKVISPSRIVSEPGLKFRENSRFKINKFFGKKAFSYTALKFGFKHGRLHDRLILGGNSNIWGGFINVSRISIRIINCLNEKGILLKKLSLHETGSISNNKNIYQLQDSDSKILDTSRFIGSHENFFLDNFFITENKIGLNLVSNLERKTIFAKKIIFCIGVTQIIDLLYRSKFLKENSIISLSEFSYTLRLKLTFSPFKFQKDSIVIRFHAFRAIMHFFGIQKFFGFFKTISNLPLYYDQKFYSKKKLHKSILKKGMLIDSFSKKIPPEKTFGRSVHYCNLKINQIDINNYLKQINPNIIGLGMAFVSQKTPGPISNDIVEDAVIKIQKINKKNI
jgi:hypothetical protein